MVFLLLKTSYKIIMKRKLIKSILFSLFVFTLGFGVMYLFWMFGEYSPKLRGLFSYYSSGIGDSIFLPIMSGSFFLYFLNSNYKFTKKQKCITYLFGLIGLLSGVTLQAYWLINPKIGLNWTIPKPNYFNMAGWYHAFFLVLMFGFTAYSFVRWLIIVHNEDNHDLCNALVSAIIWGSGAGFVYTFVIDNVKIMPSNMELFLMYAVLVIFILAFLIIFAITLFQKNSHYPGKTLFMYAACTICSISIILGIIYALIYAYKINILFSVVAFLLSFSYLAPSPDKKRVQIFKRLFIVIPAFTLTLPLTTYQTLSQLIIIGSINIVLIGFIAYFQFFNYTNSSSENNKIVKINIQYGTAFVVATLAILYIVEHNEYKELLSLIISLVIEVIGIHIVTKYFNYVKIYEKDQIETTEELQNIKVHVFTTVIALFLGSIIILLLSVAQNTKNLINTIFYLPKLNVTSGHLLVLALLLILLILIFSKVLTVPKKDNSNYVMIISFILPTILYASIIMFILSYTNPIFAYHKFDLLIFLNSISKFCMTIGTAFLISEGFYSNALLIYSKINKSTTLFLSVIVGTGVFFSNFIILFSDKIEMSLKNGNHHYIIFYLLISMCTFSILPCIIGNLLDLNNQDEVSITLVHYQQALFVDGFLYILIFTFSGLMFDLIDFVVYSNISKILLIISIYTLFIWVLSACLKNNVEHFRERKDVAIKTYAKQSKEIRQIINDKISILSRHLRIQNLMSIFALLLYSIVVVFIIILKEYWQKNDNEDIRISDILKLLKKRYWPND